MLIIVLLPKIMQLTESPTIRFHIWKPQNEASFLAVLKRQLWTFFDSQEFPEYEAPSHRVRSRGV